MRVHERKIVSFHERSVDCHESNWVQLEQCRNCNMHCGNFVNSIITFQEWHCLWEKASSEGWDKSQEGPRRMWDKNATTTLRMVDLGVRSGDRAIRQTARPPAISFQKRIPENESNNQQRELFSWPKSPAPGCGRRSCDQDLCAGSQIQHKLDGFGARSCRFWA